MPDDPFGTDAVWNAAEAPEADLGNFLQRKKSLAYKKLEWSKRLILMPILRLPLLSGTSIIGTRRLRMEANETGELVTV